MGADSHLFRREVTVQRWVPLSRNVRSFHGEIVDRRQPYPGQWGHSIPPERAAGVASQVWPDGHSHKTLALGVGCHLIRSQITVQGRMPLGSDFWGFHGKIVRRVARRPEQYGQPLPVMRWVISGVPDVGRIVPA